MNNLKIIFVAIFALVISVNSQQLLQSNRYDYKNTTNQYFSDLSEFLVCGLPSNGLSAIAGIFGQTIVDTTTTNWQSKVKVLYGSLWLNGSNYYTGCANQYQTLQRFAVRQAFLSQVLNYLQTQGLRQQISCVDEIMIRTFLSNGFGAINNTARLSIGPKLVRHVFHDAMDHNNLMNSQNQNLNAQTGVDNCLFSPLFSQSSNQVNTANADPEHNRGLDISEQYIQSNLRQLAAWIEAPDVEVLGSIVALEDWHQGPKVNFKFGRKQGNCSLFLCSLETCNNQSRFLNGHPSANSWSNSQNVKYLQQLGFNSKEFIALNGAHTIGGLLWASNENFGAYCQANFPASSLLDSNAYFDDTPAVFDNNYFKELASVQFGSSNVTQFPDCDFLSTSQKKNAAFVQQQACQQVTYCNQTTLIGEGPLNMKNLRNATQFEGRYKRIVQLPSDFNNLFDQETLAHIQLFANNQTEFFNTFSSAYERVSNLGYSNSDLQQCQPLDCAITADKTGFLCQSGFDDSLTFNINTNNDCSLVTIPSNCQLVGGFGIKGSIQCNGQLYNCPLRNSIENQNAIFKFLQQRI